MVEQMKLEGKRFLLYLKMDKARSIYEFQKCKAEIDLITVRLRQLEEMRNK
jgi:hypothetical protein